MKSGYGTWDTSMTAIEQRMKAYMERHPDQKDRILTSDALSDFMLHIVSEHLDEPIESLSDFYQGQVPASVRHLISISKNGPDDARQKMLTDLFFHQSEEEYFPEGYDVSVMRVFRYMPVHWHSNEYFTVLFCVSGICPILFEKEQVDLQKGDVLILAPNTLYASPCYRDDSVLIYYTIRVSTFYDAFWNSLSDMTLLSDFFMDALQSRHGSPYLLFQTGQDEDLSDLLYQIYLEALEQGDYANHMINGLMHVFFVRLLRRYAGQVIISRFGAGPWKTEYGRILQFIQKNYTEVTVQQLCDRFHYSERQINRIVLLCTGKNFSRLRVDLRLKKALKLLRQTTLPVEEISSAVGYRNLNAFYKFIAKNTGQTPAQIRKN